MQITCHHSGSAGNLYQVGNLLIDPGVPIKEIKKALNFGLSEIQGALVSHSHGDHAHGVKDLLKAGVDCYLSRETAESLKLSGHRTHIIEPGKVFEIGEYRIRAFPLVHDVPNLGFLVAHGDDRLVYITDTHYCPWKFHSLTHVMLGVNYDRGILRQNVQAGAVPVETAKRIIYSHMSLQTALEFFQANDMSRVQEIHVLHLSAGNSDAESFKRKIQEVTGRPVYIAQE